MNIDLLVSTIGTGLNRKRKKRTAAALPELLKTAPFFTEWTENSAAGAAILDNTETMHRDLLRMLHRFNDAVQPLSEARGGRPVWGPYWGTMLGCIRHEGIIPWDDDIDLFVMEEDFADIMAACKKAGLGIQDELFFGGRVYEKPPLIHGAAQGMLFIDLFVMMKVSDDSPSPEPCAGRGSGKFPEGYTRPAAGDYIPAPLAARQMWGDWKTRIKAEEWGDGAKSDILTLHPPALRKVVSTGSGGAGAGGGGGGGGGGFLSYLWGDRSGSDTDEGDEVSNESFPDTLRCPSFANPHGYLDRCYGTSWSTVGLIQPTHQNFLAHMTWKTEMVVRFREIRVTRELYASVYDNADSLSDAELTPRQVAVVVV